MQNQIDNNEIYNENEKERAFLISVDTGDFDALVSIKELEELDAKLQNCIKELLLSKRVKLCRRFIKQ